jgi:hypothetical protein
MPTTAKHAQHAQAQAGRGRGKSFLPDMSYHVLLSAIQGIERNMPQRLTK